MKRLLFLFCFLLFLSVDSLLGADDFVIKDFHIELTMDQKGGFEVIETIEVFFNEQRRGIFRSIPYINTVDGKKHQIRLEQLKCLSHKYKLTKEKGNKILRIGDADKYLEGLQTYRISYYVTNALMDRGENLEFFWNMTGNEWKVPIQKADYIVRLPEGTKLTEDYVRIYSGQYGDRYSEVENTFEDTVLRGMSTTPIYPGSGFSIAVLIPKSVFQNPNKLSFTESPGSKKTATPRPTDRFFPIPMALLSLFGLWYWMTGRDPKEPLVSLQHHPPANMGPTEVGTFYDYQVNDRDIIALIPKWGNEGLIKLSAGTNTNGDGDLYFTKTGEISASAPTYELTLFNGLFGQTSFIFLDELKNKFYKTFYQSKSLARKQHFDNGLYDERSKSIFHSKWLIALFILCLIGGITLLALEYFLTGAATIVFAIILMIIKSRRPRLSERGLQLNRHLTGFHSFLSDPHPDDLSLLLDEDPEYLQKVFPYVVAFGLDNKWNSALEKMSVPPPYWYEDERSTHRNYSNFSKSFNVRNITSAFSSAPASSSGSRGSRGGSSGGSGGGFGGGGGGSW